MKRTVVEDCEIVNVTETSSCYAFGFQFATVPTRARGRRLCLLPLAVAEPSSSIGHHTYNRSRVELAITLLTPASKSTTYDSIDS